MRPMPPTVARNSSRLDSRAALDDAAVGDAQLERGDVRAEAAVAVVVLAVDVGGDHAAQRDELGARRDRGEPAARQEQAVQIRPATARPRRAGRRCPRRTPGCGRPARVETDLAVAGGAAATSRRTSGRGRATAAGRRRCAPGPPSAPRAPARRARVPNRRAFRLCDPSTPPNVPGPAAGPTDARDRAVG